MNMAETTGTWRKKPNEDVQGTPGRDRELEADRLPRGIPRIIQTDRHALHAGIQEMATAEEQMTVRVALPETDRGEHRVQVQKAVTGRAETARAKHPESPAAQVRDPAEITGEGIPVMKEETVHPVVLQGTNRLTGHAINSDRFITAGHRYD